MMKLYLWVLIIMSDPSDLIRKHRLEGSRSDGWGLEGGRHRTGCLIWASSSSVVCWLETSRDRWAALKSIFPEQIWHGWGYVEGGRQCTATDSVFHSAGNAVFKKHSPTFEGSVIMRTDSTNPQFPRQHPHSGSPSEVRMMPKPSSQGWTSRDLHWSLVGCVVYRWN